MAMLARGEEIFVWELLSSGLLRLLLPVSRAETHINQPICGRKNEVMVIKDWCEQWER